MYGSILSIVAGDLRERMMVVGSSNVTPGHAVAAV